MRVTGEWSLFLVAVVGRFPAHAWPDRTFTDRFSGDGVERL